MDDYRHISVKDQLDMIYELINNGVDPSSIEAITELPLWALIPDEVKHIWHIKACKGRMDWYDQLDKYLTNLTTCGFRSTENFDEVQKAVRDSKEKSVTRFISAIKKEIPT